MHQVRTADECDIPQIVDIVNAAFQVEREFRVGTRTSFADVKGLMESGTFLVALQEEKIVGAVMVRVNGKIGYFGMLAVRPGLQRLGIGRALLQEAETHCRARDCTEITLSTGGVREELLRYYSKLGYAVTKMEPAPADAPFTKPIVIVTMAKRL